MFQKTSDLRIAALRPLLPPAILHEELPITDHASNVVADGRAASRKIIRGEEDRLLVVVGPFFPNRYTCAAARMGALNRWQRSRCARGARTAPRIADLVEVAAITPR